DRPRAARHQRFRLRPDLRAGGLDEDFRRVGAGREGRPVASWAGSAGAPAVPAEAGGLASQPVFRTDLPVNVPARSAVLKIRPRGAVFHRLSPAPLRW